MLGVQKWLQHSSPHGISARQMFASSKGKVPPKAAMITRQAGKKAAVRSAYIFIARGRLLRCSIWAPVLCWAFSCCILTAGSSHSPPAALSSTPVQLSRSKLQRALQRAGAWPCKIAVLGVHSKVQSPTLLATQASRKVDYTEFACGHKDTSLQA